VTATAGPWQAWHPGNAGRAGWVPALVAGSAGQPV